MYTHTYTHMRACVYYYIYIYNTYTFQTYCDGLHVCCESQALNAKVDQGQTRSASNLDAATYDSPELL